MTKEIPDHETTQVITQFVRDGGFPMPRKPPGEELQWPSNVADLSPDELAQQLTYWSAWAGYTRVVVAKAEINEVAYKRTVETVRSRRMLELDGEYKTVTALKVAVENDEVLVIAGDNQDASKSMRKMLKAFLDTYEDRCKVLSREISRRGMDAEFSRRQT